MQGGIDLRIRSENITFMWGYLRERLVKFQDYIGMELVLLFHKITVTISILNVYSMPGGILDCYIHYLIIQPSKHLYD